MIHIKNILKINLPQDGFLKVCGADILSPDQLSFFGDRIFALDLIISL